MAFSEVTVHTTQFQVFHFCLLQRYHFRIHTVHRASVADLSTLNSTFDPRRQQSEASFLDCRINFGVLRQFSANVSRLVAVFRLFSLLSSQASLARI